MNGKVSVECPHCGRHFVQSLFGLLPGVWRHCPECNGAIRFTAEDLRHLRQAIAERDKRR